MDRHLTVFRSLMSLARPVPVQLTSVAQRVQAPKAATASTFVTRMSWSECFKLCAVLLELNPNILCLLGQHMKALPGCQLSFSLATARTPLHCCCSCMQWMGFYGPVTAPTTLKFSPGDCLLISEPNLGGTQLFDQSDSTPWASGALISG